MFCPEVKKQLPWNIQGTGMKRFEDKYHHPSNAQSPGFVNPDPLSAKPIKIKSTQTSFGQSVHTVFKFEATQSKVTEKSYKNSKTKFSYQ